MTDTELIRPAHGVAWNLMLAVIPVLLAFLIASRVRQARREGRGLPWAIVLPLLAVWLAFLPNTCYLVTEWRHFLKDVTDNRSVYQAMVSKAAMFDILWAIAFYIVYTGIGLLTFFLAVWPLDHMVRPRVGRGIWPLQALFFALCGLGVYLGLIPRFNSWNLIQPSKAPQVVAAIGHILARPVLVGMIVLFGGVLWAAYTAFDIFTDGLRQRVRTHRRARGAAAERAEATASEAVAHGAVASERRETA